MHDALRWFARSLATAMLAGEWTEQAIIERAWGRLGRRRRWLRGLAQRLMVEYRGVAPPPRERLTDFILTDRGFKRACEHGSLADDDPVWHDGALADSTAAMRPVPGPPAAWPVAALTTPAELVAWSGVSLPDWDWFADVQGRGRRAPDGPLRHYRYRWIRKRRGSPRLLEVPKQRLKRLQRSVLRDILNHIPPHAAAHGFRTGCDVRSFVAPHVGRHVVLRMDLRDFFPSIGRARVMRVFQTAGYPEGISRLLAGVCTNAAPSEVFDALPEPIETGAVRSLRTAYSVAHLPQGAPTSPALANLCTFRLDCRLTGLAAAARARYTRYADDLLFSGGADFARSVYRFQVHVAAIALDEGFEVQHRKTRVMRRGVRQHAAGIVLNDRPNVTRAEYDRLKAILHNCVQRVPDGQNRANHNSFRAHLMGRIAHVTAIHPKRGARLLMLFRRIRW